MSASLADQYLGDSANCFALFGATVACYLTLRFLCSVWSGIKAFFLARSLGLSTNVRKLGAWAVVTGSTDGIGKVYAQELARQGMKVVLISRNPDKLSDVAQEIESKYNVETKTIAVDFTRGQEIYKTIKKGIENLEVGVLVNNVGMSYPCPMYFTEVEKLSGEEMLPNLLRCNIDSVTLVTNIVLPQMVERRKGAVINISSASGAVPQPLLSVYSASKAYVDFFSRALQVEYKSKGIIVQSVMPSFVATKLSKIRKASFMVPSPTSYVREALGTLGVQSRTFGCLAHAVQGWLTLHLPEFVVSKVGMALLLPARNKGIKKLEKNI